VRKEENKERRTTQLKAGHTVVKALEGFTRQPPIPLNRPKIYLTITTQQNEEMESIIVIYDLIIVILEIFRIF
jgi:hypothetical protein